MDKKVTGIVSYITLIGWLIAYLAGDKEGAKFHLNQALVIILIGLVGGIVLSWVPFIGSILKGALGLAQLVYMILGIVSAVKEEENPLPLIGGIKLLK